ncbi:MAG: hypothetical protein AB7P40_06565 [Chloroflexota bacterium]
MHQLPRLLGTVAFVAVSLFGLAAQPSWANSTSDCDPAVTTSTDMVRRIDGAITDIDVRTQAATTSDGGNRLTAVTVTQAVNSSVQVDGRPVAVPTTITLPSPQTWTFRVHRLDADEPFQVDYVVRDRCGDVSRFIGAGTGDGRLAAPGQDGPVPPPTSSTAPTPGTTATPTLPATSAPATRSPTATLTPVSATTTATPALITTPTPIGASDPAGRIDVGALRLTTTFRSIGIELPFDGDPNQNATADLSFRRVGDSAWRAGLDLWPTTEASGAAFYGSTLLLQPGTPYEIRVAVVDPDGVTGSPVQTATITTRAETIAPPGALTPSYFVRANGTDTADGRSVATAWGTIDKAIKDAPSGAIVQVGPGHYPTSRAVIGGWTYARSLPLTLVAQYPAVNDDHQPVNEAQRSVIEPIGLSSPTGAADGPNPGVWQQVTLTGPTTGGSYTVWAWINSPVSEATQLGYALSRSASPVRVAHWKKDTRDLASPAGWAEKIATNLTYNAGFYATGRDIYVRLPGNLDPNTLHITAANKSHTGLAINGPDVRVSGFEIRQFSSGIEVMWGARNATIDHSLLTGNLTGVFFRAQGTTYGSDHVVQDNIIQDANLWSVNPQAPAIPWMFIKSTVRNADGSDYATSKVGANSESAAITGRGSAQRVVVRRNIISGTFDGVRNGYNDGFDRYASQDMDVYDNVIQQVADDALEPELAAINFRAWNNRIDQSLTVLSTGPVKFGPVYLFRNTAWRTGRAGTGPDGQGRLPASAMFKYSGVSNPAARIYVVHNTFWTDVPEVSGGAQLASYGSNPEHFWLRNNLIRATMYAFDSPSASATWDEDANYFATTHPDRGLRYNKVIYDSNVPAYRVASGQGPHTNAASGFTTDVSVRSGSSGDLRLPSGSPLIDAGVPVPNISDQSGADYQGGAPDIGFEPR